MQNKLSLSLICEKINELQHALFFNESSSMLKMSTQVIHVLFTDDEGNIWFMIPPHFQKVLELEGAFPAKLIFLKKGVHFFLEVAGNAVVIGDPGSVQHISKISEAERMKLYNGERMLLKIKICHSDLTEFDPGIASVNWISSIQQSFSSFCSYTKFAIGKLWRGLLVRNINHLSDHLSH